jgi:hypothetical protein
MTLALLTSLMISSTPVASAPSLAPDLYMTHLSPRQGMLVESLGSKAGQIVSGVRLTVSGSICTILGLVSGGGGVYALLMATTQTGSAALVSTVLGWTFFGIGAVFLLVGLPLLIVGIVNLATVPANPGRARLQLGLTQRGELAVVF